MSLDLTLLSGNEKKWNISKQKTYSFAIESPLASSKVIGIAINSDMLSMQFIDVALVYPEKGISFKTNIIIEWEGLKVVNLRISDFKKSGWNKTDVLDTGSNKEACKADDLSDEGLILEFTAQSSTYTNFMIGLGEPAWYDDMPLIDINEGECLLVDFSSPRFWDLEDWTVKQDSFPVAEHGLTKEWFYANPWYLCKSGRYNNVSITKRFNTNIKEYQTIIINLSIDKRSKLNVYTTIDGKQELKIDHMLGLEKGIEARIPIDGNILSSITIELESDYSSSDKFEAFKILSFFRWILLERKGFDHSLANGVKAIKKIGNFTDSNNLVYNEFPVGILFDKRDITDLRKKITKGAAKTVFEDIIKELERNMNFNPEDYIGMYAPVDMLSQGIERDNSPKMQRAISSNMINGGLAYILTDELKYGLLAKRALLSVINIQDWTGGFVSRIPQGIAGYRAPFIESHICEAAALCYDMIFGLLTQDERKSVEDAFYNKAVPWIDSYLRLYGDGYLFGSNQGAVYSMGIIFASLIARRSHPDIDSILFGRIDWFLKMLNNYYRTDGSTAEGPSYWEYTTYCAILGILALARFKKESVDKIAPANFKASIEYMEHIRSLVSEKLKFLSISDTVEKTEMAYAGPAFLFSSKYFNDKGALWVWKKYFNFIHEPDSKFFGTITGGSCTGVPLLTLLLLDDAEVYAPQLPLFKMFSDSKRVFLRTGAEKRDILLFFEGGAQTFEHTHLDKGQFIIEAYGERLLTDPGVINYGNPNSILYKSTAYHNLATVKGRNQNYKDASKAVAIVNLKNCADYSYIHADLSNSYIEFTRYERYILFIRPYYFIIMDCIDSCEDGIEWHLHSKGNFLKQVNDDDVALYNISANTAGMLLYVTSNNLLSESLSSYYDEEGIVSNNLTLEPPQGVKKFIVSTLMYPYIKEDDFVLPKISYKKIDTHKFVYRVEHESYTDIIECNLADGFSVLREEGKSTRKVFKSLLSGS